MKKKIIPLLTALLFFTFTNKSDAQSCSANGFEGELTSYQVTENSITVYWDVSFTPAPAPYEGYAVWYRLNDINRGVSNWVNATPAHPVYGTNFFYDNRNFFTINGLSTSASYEIEIVHLCNGVQKAHAYPFKITTAAAPTATIKGPINVRAVNIRNTSAEINFDYYPITLYKVSLDNFYVYYRKDGTTNWILGTIVTPGWFANDLTITGLTAGTKYFLRVDEYYTLNPGESYASTSAVSSSSTNYFITTGYGEANPGPPVAVATTTPSVLAFGTTQTTLSGTGSNQPFGTNKTITYQWRQLPTYLTYIPTPTSHTPSFAWPLQETSQNTTVIDLKSGNYVYELAVKNVAGVIKKDTVKFEVLAECGSHKGSFSVPVRKTQPGLDFYSGTIFYANTMALTNTTHTYKGGAVILYPGFVSNVTGTNGAFTAVAFDITKCPGYIAPTARNATSTEFEYTEPYKEELPDINNTKNVTQVKEGLIFPNPTKGLFTIRLPGLTETIKQVNIINVSGVRVAGSNNNSRNINISSLAQGLYFYQIQTDKKVYTGKLQKQ
jgi:Secretion system C-terminal sorting domain